MSRETDSAKHLISLIRSVASSIAGRESGPGFKLVFDAVDDSDVQKPYGKAFEAMSLVRDGSAKKKDTYGMGFMVTSIVCTTAKFKQPMCIFDRTRSSAEKDYLSANNAANEGIRRICAKLEPLSATFAFGRGYDDAKVMRLMASLGQHYVIRMRKDRNIRVGGRKTKAFAEAGKRKGKVVIPMVYKGKGTYCRASHVNARMGA